MPSSQAPWFAMPEAFEEWRGRPNRATPPRQARPPAGADHQPAAAQADPDPLLAETPQALRARDQGFSIFPEHFMPSDNAANLGGRMPDFFTDDHLARPQMKPGSLGHPQGLLGQLLLAPEREMRLSLVKQALRQNGFEWLAYGTLRPRNGGLHPMRFLSSYAHQGWAEHYFAHGFHEVDVRHKDAPASGLPLVWDLESLEQAQSRQPLRLDSAETAARQRRFLDDMERHGIRSGVFLRLATPGQSGDHTFISCLSRTPSRRWIIQRVTGNALALGLSIHEYVSQHVLAGCAAQASQSPAADGPSNDGLAGLISPTQRAILEELMAGCSDKEIAYRLGLSGYAVDYHMRQLRRRFQVRNRVKLASVAAALWKSERPPE